MRAEQDAARVGAELCAASMRPSVVHVHMPTPHIYTHGLIHTSTYTYYTHIQTHTYTHIHTCTYTCKQCTHVYIHAIYIYT